MSIMDEHFFKKLITRDISFISLNNSNNKKNNNNNKKSTVSCLRTSDCHTTL